MYLIIINIMLYLYESNTFKLHKILNAIKKTNIFQHRKLYYSYGQKYTITASVLVTSTKSVLYLYKLRKQLVQHYYIFILLLL